LKAYVCIEVFEGVRPVKLVTREDGGWCFLCGEGHPDRPDFVRVIGIGHEFDRDPTLLELIDLPDDWEAERADVGAAWVRMNLRTLDAPQ
jgi:hypothetical protein